MITASSMKAKSSSDCSSLGIMVLSIGGASFTA